VNPSVNPIQKDKLQKKTFFISSSSPSVHLTMSIVAGVRYFAVRNKEAQLTPGLARDRAATWQLTLNLDSSAAIGRITCAATWRKR